MIKVADNLGESQRKISEIQIYTNYIIPNNVVLEFFIILKNNEGKVVNN